MEPFKNQVSDLKNEVNKAKIKDSKTIEKTAEDLFGFNENKINIFGTAFKDETFVSDSHKGLKENINFKLNAT